MRASTWYWSHEERWWPSLNVYLHPWIRVDKYFCYPRASIKPQGELIGQDDIKPIKQNLGSFEDALYP